MCRKKSNASYSEELYIKLEKSFNKNVANLKSS